MEWYNYVIPIVTLIVGGVGGFFIGVFYLRKQLEKMQSDPEMLQKMAKQMGYNLNGKQMQRAQQMMKNQGGAGAPQNQKFIPNQRGGKRK
ncbi:MULTISPECIES: YneF family protein [Paenibacillus]|uniref:YneF family protein n=1 Tax=Paenibacillus TaxID=44249 RepID=UPI0003901DD8|nr:MULTISPECIES: YneF family protein [Paenibacillus]KKC47931.1 hypothetical protein VE23_13765 [Paenibacillus sp. D9]CDN43628.1 hypothetical protein BN871_DG_00020 [Paenibacillus sp. P22]SIQ89889.1 hypothetical protein SAMN05880555_2652 [Paenibacillus sp. RU4X]SIR10684.1 hypothetical protein SAMN05880570_2652 [Paenibacillus sp. RU4T]